MNRRGIFVGLALLLSGCASAGNAPVTVHTRGDDDPDVLGFANQRFSGQRGFCLLTDYYKLYRTATTCGVTLTDEEEHNFRTVLTAIEHAITANARGEQVAGLRLRQVKSQIDENYRNLTGEDRLNTCGGDLDVLQRVVQNYLSKRVSDSVLRQSQDKGDPFEVFCTS